MNDLPRPLPLPGPWHRRGACRSLGPGVFFVDKGEDYEDARVVCARCEVRSECLNYALTNRIRHGFWGGLSEVERRHIRRTYVVRRSARIVLPAVECPSCHEAGAVVPRDRWYWWCLDCRVQWPALGETG